MASQPQYIPPPQIFAPPGGKNDSSTTIIILVVVVLFLISMSISVYFLFFNKREGGKCNLEDKDDEDKNGIYKYDEDLDCVLDSCKKGYEVSGTSCIKERKAGDSCKGSDSKGTYKLDSNKICKLQSCSTGYKVENGKCVSTTPASTTRATSPAVSGKIFHYEPLSGWVDPGHKGMDGHITGTSIEECAAKVPADAVIVGWRDGSHDAGDGNDYKNTCFYYTSQQAPTGPYTSIDNHHVACMDATMDINTGCGGPVVTGKFFGAGGGWSDPGSTLVQGHIAGSSLADCVARAPANAKIAGWRDTGYTRDPSYQNTCFYYTTNKAGTAFESVEGHTMTCMDPKKDVNTGCA